MNANISELIGKTMLSVTGAKGDDEIVFTATTGEAYKMYHCQDCCENVRVEDICGELGDLVGSPIVMAEESLDGDENPPAIHADSYTWTFYRIATAKGLVVLRWLGTSNGYYSERVDFVRIR
jgi:hypothetical protein